MDICNRQQVTIKLESKLGKIWIYILHVSTENWECHFGRYKKQKLKSENVPAISSELPATRPRSYQPCGAPWTFPSPCHSLSYPWRPCPLRGSRALPCSSRGARRLPSRRGAGGRLSRPRRSPWSLRPPCPDSIDRYRRVQCDIKPKSMKLSYGSMRQEMPAETEDGRLKSRGFVGTVRQSTVESKAHDCQ